MIEFILGVLLTIIFLAIITIGKKPKCKVQRKYKGAWSTIITVDARAAGTILGLMRKDAGEGRIVDDKGAVLWPLKT